MLRVILPLPIALTLLLSLPSQANALLVSAAPKTPVPAFLPNESESRIGLLCSNDPMDLSDPMGLYWLPLTKAQQKIFDQVRKYLSRDDGMKKLFEAIDKDRAHGVKVVFTDDFKSSNKDQFKGFGNSKGPTRAEFEWNPAAARSNTNGTKSSPAMVFGHELDHVVRWLNDPKGYERDNKPDGPGAYHQFGTFEERRVIRGSETHAAETLRKYGEGVRNDGGGAPYRVESPTFD